MGVDFNNVLQFPDLSVWFFVEINLLVSFFATSGIMGIIFRKFSGLTGRVSAVFAGRLRFVGLRRRNSSFRLEKKTITCNLHHFVFVFLTGYNVLRIPVIYVALPFRGVVRT